MNIKPLIALSVAAALTLAGTGVATAQPNNGVLMRPDGIYLRCDQCGTVQGVQHNVTQGRNSGTAGAIIPWGASYMVWGDQANPTGWSAAGSILEPTPMPLASVATAPAASGNGLAFTATVAGGTQFADGAGQVIRSGHHTTLRRRCRYGTAPGHLSTRKH